MSYRANNSKWGEYLPGGIGISIFASLPIFIFFGFFRSFTLFNFWVILLSVGIIAFIGIYGVASSQDDEVSMKTSVLMICGYVFIALLTLWGFRSPKPGTIEGELAEIRSKYDDSILLIKAIDDEHREDLRDLKLDVAADYSTEIKSLNKKIRSMKYNAEQLCKKLTVYEKVERNIITQKKRMEEPVYCAKTRLAAMQKVLDTELMPAIKTFKLNKEHVSQKLKKMNITNSADLKGNYRAQMIAEELAEVINYISVLTVKKDKHIKACFELEVLIRRLVNRHNATQVGITDAQKQGTNEIIKRIEMILDVSSQEIEKIDPIEFDAIIEREIGSLKSANKGGSGTKSYN